MNTNCPKCNGTDGVPKSIVHSSPDSNTVRLFVQDAAEENDGPNRSGPRSNGGHPVAPQPTKRSPASCWEQCFDETTSEFDMNDDAARDDKNAAVNRNKTQQFPAEELVCADCTRSRRTQKGVNIVNVGPIFDKYNSDNTSTGEIESGRETPRSNGTKQPDANDDFNGHQSESEQVAEARNRRDKSLDDEEQQNSESAALERLKSTNEHPRSESEYTNVPQPQTDGGVYSCESLPTFKEEEPIEPQIEAPMENEMDPTDGSPERYPYDPTYNEMPYLDAMSLGYTPVNNTTGGGLESTADTDGRNTWPADMSLISPGVDRKQGSGDTLTPTQT